MPRNTEIDFNNLQELIKCCESTLDNLSKFYEQLTKVIEVKKKQAESASGGMIFSQAQDSSSASTNLATINAKLPGAISEIKQLHQQTLSLVQHLGLQPAPALRQGSGLATAVNSAKDKAEQKLLTPNEIAKKVVDVIDSILTTGDWERSVFLKASAVKLRSLRELAETLSHFGENKQVAATASAQAAARRAIPPGYNQVFILLYQVDGTNLQGWCHNIKNLVDYSVNRPAYQDESFAKEVVRSKVADIECNGYVVVNVKNDAFYSSEPAPVDNFGHKLFVLKENSIKLESIIEFVHANKKHYVLRDNELVLLG